MQSRRKGELKFQHLNISLYELHHLNSFCIFSNYKWCFWKRKAKTDYIQQIYIFKKPRIIKVCVTLWLNLERTDTAYTASGSPQLLPEELGYPLSVSFNALWHHHPSLLFLHIILFCLISFRNVREFKSAVLLKWKRKIKLLK